MGILNVTPDSFSDGGKNFDPCRAVATALRMIDDGVDIIDIGPESTRPGADAIPPEEQLARALPVLEQIREANGLICLSIDTRSAKVARAALDAGVDMVNDVSALRDDRAMAKTIASAGCGVILMHRHGTSQSMQADGGPTYDDVIQQIDDFLRERIEFALNAGIDPSRVVIDPGIGFGKRVEHNLAIIREAHRFVATGYPVLLGASRKSFLGKVLRIDLPAQRDPASLACAAWAAEAGVAILRVHDVRATVEMARLHRAVRERAATEVEQQLSAPN